MFEREKNPTAGTVVAHDGSAMTDSPEVLKALYSGQATLSPLARIGEELSGYKNYDGVYHNC